MAQYIETTGVRETLRAVGKMQGDDYIRIADGLGECATIILVKSLKYVPRDTHALASTGHTTVTGRGFGARATVEYGGPSQIDDTIVDYAWIVHENDEAHHEPPTSAHYLSRAVRETRGRCRRAVRRQFESTLTGVRGPNDPNRLRGMRDE